MAQSFGINDYIRIPNPDYNNLEELSFSFWFYSTQAISYPLAHTNTSETLDNIFFAWSSLGLGIADIYIRRSVTPARFYANSTGCLLGVWYHFVCTWKLDEVPNIYLNGNALTIYSAALTGAGAGALPGDDGPIYLGNSILTDCAGRLTEVGYWNRKLTAAEITNLSNTPNPYSPVVIPDGLVGAWRLYGNASNNTEPDYISNQTGDFVGSPTAISNPYSFITRLEDTSSPQLLGSSNPSFQRGHIIAQAMSLSSETTVDKVSVYLNTVSETSYDRIQEEDGIASWSALNFQEISDKHDWTIYYNDLSEYEGQDDLSVGQGFLTNANAVSYTSADEVYLVSPSVSYNLNISDGTYRIWVRATGSGDFWYSWDFDTTPDKLSLPSSLIWKYMGEITVNSNNHRTLHVYMGNASAQNIKIDEFKLVGSDLVNNELAERHISYPETGGPYNIFVRIRDTDSNGDVQPASSSSIIGWGWLSSNKIHSPGWFNFKINRSVFSEGLSIEYIVISGNKKTNAQWNYVPSVS